jgi:hypothetical protein
MPDGIGTIYACRKPASVPENRKHVNPFLPEYRHL